MARWWDDAIEALNVLVEKVAGQDKDGVDLSFTNGRVKLTNQKGGTKIKAAMKEAQPDRLVGTNMSKALGDILSDYYSYVLERRKAPKKFKGLTVIVLTDGIWEGMTNKAGVEDTVVNFLENLGDLIGHTMDRLATIELIQFGHDKDATHMLEQLEGNLKWRGVP